MNAEAFCDLPHGVDAGQEGASHGLASLGVTTGKVREGLGQGPSLCSRDLAQALEGLGRTAVALDKAYAAEKDLMVASIGVLGVYAVQLAHTLG